MAAAAILEMAASWPMLTLSRGTWRLIFSFNPSRWQNQWETLVRSPRSRKFSIWPNYYLKKITLVPVMTLKVKKWLLWYIYLISIMNKSSLAFTLFIWQTGSTCMNKICVICFSLVQCAALKRKFSYFHFE